MAAPSANGGIFPLSSTAVQLGDNALAYVYGFAASMLHVLTYILAALIIEAILVGWARSSLRRLLIKPSASAVTDIKSLLLTISPLGPIFATVLTLGFSGAVFSLTARYLQIGFVSSLSPITVLLIFLVLADLLDYVGHRLSHEIGPLWRLHRYHHGATEMTVANGWRQHPVDLMWYYMAYGVLGGILGGSPAQLYAVFVFRLVWTGLQHSELQWSLGPIGKYFLISPAAHRIHHSLDPQHYNCNYGTLLPIWDMAFGTFRAPTDRVTAFGLPEQDLNRRSFVLEILTCYLEFLRAVLNNLRRAAVETRAKLKRLSPDGR